MSDDDSNGWFTTKKKPIPYDTLVEGLWSIQGGPENIAHIGFARADCVVFKCKQGHEHCKIIAAAATDGWVASGAHPDFWRPQQGVPRALPL